MKKKLLLLTIMIMAVMCIFAISASAESKIIKLDYDPGLDCPDSVVSILEGDYAPYTPVTWASVEGGLDTESKCVLTDGNGGYYVFPAWYIYRDEAYETNRPNNHNSYKHCLRYGRLNDAIAKYNADNGTDYYAEYSYTSNNQVNLVRLNILNGVCYIANDTQSFNGSASLVELTFPSSLGNMNAGNTIRGTGITSVDLSKTKITSIPDSFAYGLTGLTEVMLPSTIKSISNNAFRECTGLTFIDLSNTVLTTINQYAFQKCTLLTGVKLPATISAINSCAFNDCTALEFVDFAENTASEFKMSGWGTFYNCTSLKAISLPKSTTIIGDRCFSNCTSLTAVYLGESLQRISGNKGEATNNGPAFASCTNMYFVQEPFSALRENGSFYSASEYTLPVKPKVYYFPETLKVITGTGNLNNALWVRDFTYSYTLNEETGIYELNIDDDGYPIIAYSSGDPQFSWTAVTDKDGNKIVNQIAYLFEYETDENGALVLTATVQNNKTYMMPTIKRDAEGNVVYRLDENNEKIPVLDRYGRTIQGMDENGMIRSHGGYDDLGIYGCKNLNSVLVFPEGFTGYYDGTNSCDENQRGDIFGTGMLGNCATAENPLTLVFLGRIDRVSMDRYSGRTSYMTYVFANEANTGFDNTKIGTYYSPGNGNFNVDNQKDMYVIFCHADGGAQKYKINFVKDTNDEGAEINYPVLNATLQEKTSDVAWHIYNPRNDSDITPATCITDAYGTLYCFCGTMIGTQTVEGSRTGIHIFKDDYNCTTADPCTSDPSCVATSTVLAHTIYETLEYALGFTNSGAYTYGCSNEYCTAIDKTATPKAIFRAGNGFATKLGTNDGISGAYYVNLAELYEYNRVHADNKLTFGIMIVDPDYFDGKDSFITADGKVNADKYLQLDMSDTKYSDLTVMLTGFANANDISLIISLYAYVEGEDGLEIEFIQSQTTSCANEKVKVGKTTLYTITYTSVAESAGKSLSELGDYIMPTKKEQTI